MIPPRNEITVLHPLTHEQSVDVVERVMRVFDERSNYNEPPIIHASFCFRSDLQRGLDIEFGLTEPDSL